MPIQLEPRASNAAEVAAVPRSHCLPCFERSIEIQPFNLLRDFHPGTSIKKDSDFLRDVEGLVDVYIKNSTSTKHTNSFNQRYRSLQAKIKQTIVPM